MRSAILVTDVLETSCTFCRQPLQPTSDYRACPMWLHRRGVWACRPCYNRRNVKLPVWAGGIDGTEQKRERQSSMRFVA